MSNTTVGVPTKSPLLTDRLYDALKFLALVILPAAGSLYFALAQIWGLPAAEEVVGTIVALDTFLGVALRISTKQYEKTEDAYAGTVGLVVHPDGRESIKFDVTADPETIAASGKQVAFKVVPKHRAPMDADDEVDLN